MAGPWRATRALRAWIGLLVLAALAAAARHPALHLRDLLVVLTLPVLAAFEVEVARQAGDRDMQRLHKGLSAWPFAAVALSGSTAAILVTVPTYAYARWRGVKVPLLKWVGSGAVLSLAAAAAQPVLPHLAQPDASALLLLVLGVVTFLAVETLGFFGCALAGEREDEQWLRNQLTSRGWYLNEGFVLSQATVIAVVWSANPVLVLVLLPSYAVLQRALMHAPLRQAAETDAKTGLLLLHAWESRARSVLAKGAPFSVVLIDLDHFKRVNDRHGHLVGDDVLKGLAEVLRSGLRPGDVLGRFGGEEFCVLLPDSDAEEARAVAERLREAIATTAVEGIELTASFGCYASGPADPARLREALACADLALYAAKECGRNVVRAYRPPVIPHQAAAADQISCTG